MAAEDLTNDDLEYIERSGFVPPVWNGSSPTTLAPPELRATLRIDGVGRLDKRERPARADDAASPTAALLVALHHHEAPVAFQVDATAERVGVYLGTWLPSGFDASAVVRNASLLASGLDAVFSGVEAADAAPAAHSWRTGGLALGIPTNRPPDPVDRSVSIDRLLRAVVGGSWRALVLAQPVNRDVVRNLRLRLINEMRSVQAAAKVGGAPSPLAEQYQQLLKAQLASLSEAQGSGAWRTAVYLLGGATSYHGLASLWRGVFLGERSLPEPIRVWQRDEAPALAEAWALIDPLLEAGVPGQYAHPFQHQTLLTSTQLAAYVQLPNVETNGFTITQVPDFDVAPRRPATGNAVTLGSIVERNRLTPTAFAVDPDSLTRHAFVTGITGSGKTNTVFRLVREVAGRGLPFLVVEPAKTEYRVLIRDAPVGEHLRVFTLGDERVSPFRLNPFEIPDGIPPATHLDLLRSVFNVSFGMWTPLPQVLEAALHGVYTDRGWDITLGVNRRLDDEAERARGFPTLGDLVGKVEEIVPGLGYEQKVTDDILAALRTRLNGLRTGGKGRMLDVRRSVPFAVLLGAPTILELEGMGDDDDKAFMMGLLMIRLAEHRRTEGDVDHLRHLLVIEEAHRLLASTSGPRRDETEPDVRGKAVETFANLLSEVRAYGQGVVVVDQIPAKLAPDVVKNTNLKVAHQVVAGDDRQVLGAAMTLTERQSSSLATLPIGRAAVFAGGEDAPLLVQVPKVKGGSGTWPTDNEVRHHMAARSGPIGDLLRLPTEDCDERCAAAPEACATARRVLEDPRVLRTLRRLVFSMALTPGAFDRCWPDVVATVEPHRPAGLDPGALVRCLAGHGAQTIADQRGARAGWSYSGTTALAEAIDTAVMDHLDRDERADALGFQLRLQLLAGQGGELGPFEGCARIWGEHPDPCLCRYPVAELVAGGGFADAWSEARDRDRETGGAARPAVWDLCLDAAYHLVEFPAEDQDAELAQQLGGVVEATAVCFAQQMLAAEEWAHPSTQRRVVTELLEQAAADDGGDDG